MNNTLMVVKFETVEEAVSQASVVKALMEEFPAFQATIWVSRFDNDPRELDEIPESRNMLRAFGEGLGSKYLVRFELKIAAMVLTTMDCGVVRIGYDFIIPPPIQDKLLEAAAEWDRRCHGL